MNAPDVNEELPEASDLVTRIGIALRKPEPDPKITAVLDKWRHFKFTVKSNGKWVLEGFVNFFQMHHELARAVDPDFSDRLPSQCFSSREIAEFFGLPSDAFAEQESEYSDDTGRILNETHELVCELHRTLVASPLERLESLTPMERDLYVAALEDKPMGAVELCQRTRIHDLDSRAKGALANLVKCGLLRKIRAKNGYVKAPL